MSDFRPFPEIGLESRRESPEEIAIRLHREAKNNYFAKCRAITKHGRFGHNGKFVRYNQFKQPVIVRL